MSFKNFINEKFKDDAKGAEEILQKFQEELANTYVPITRLNEEIEAHKQAKAGVAERDKQIKELEGFKGTTEELNAKVAELTKANEEAVAASAKAIQAIKVETAVKGFMGNHETYKPHDADLVYGLLDVSKIELGEDGKLKGVEEQLKEIHEKRSFVFVTPTPPTPPVDPKNPFNILGGIDPKNPSGGNPPTKSPAAGYGELMAQTKLGNMGKSKPKE